MELFRALMGRDAERCSGDGLCGIAAAAGCGLSEVETTVAMTAKDAAALFESARRFIDGEAVAAYDNDIATSAAHARADARTCSVGGDPSADVTSSLFVRPDFVNQRQFYRVPIPLV